MGLLKVICIKNTFENTQESPFLYVTKIDS